MLLDGFREQKSYFLNGEVFLKSNLLSLSLVMGSVFGASRPLAANLSSKGGWFH